MRNLFIGFALSAALSLPASAADVRNFTIVNGTGYEIEFIGVNPPDDDDFGENELSDGLANGKSVYIKFNNADHGCSWNIKVKWTGYSDEVLFKDFDLCTISKATLRYDRGTQKTTALVE
jgi:hypothetical protein